MSFFALAQKQTLEKQHKIGPGHYSYDNIHNKKAAYAPFGSLQTRKTLNLNQGIGPGQYNVATNILQPSISRYENKNIIIVKINDEGSAQFKSRTNRFNNLTMTDVGPAYYSVSNFKNKVKCRQRKNKKISQQLKQVYNQYKKSHYQNPLTSDPIQSKTQTMQTTTKKINGVSWQKNKKQRFSPLIKQKFTKQDKQRALSQTNYKKKIIKPSAVFASKSVKSHLQTQIYHTNNHFKVQLRKMINYKDQLPGPGSYQFNNNAKKKSKQNKFQFFGSTVQRFSSDNNLNEIGPGKYNPCEPNNYFHRPTRYQAQNFQIDRHSYLPNKSYIPGPGYYNYKQIVQKQQKQQNSFGSKIPRFTMSQQKKVKKQNDLNDSGLLWQRQLKKQTQIKIRKMIIDNVPNAVFASSCQRFSYPKPQEYQQAHYNTDNQSIAVKLQRQTKIQKQLQSCHLYKPPFLTSDQRFKEHKQQSQIHKDCWCMVKVIQKQNIQRQSPVFISNQSRIKVFQNKNNGPPIGIYNYGANNMIKDSFNSRFRKKNEIKTKRINKMNITSSNKQQSSNNQHQLKIHT